jgi:hypothetical protein
LHAGDVLVFEEVLGPRQGARTTPIRRIAMPCV